MADCGVMGDIVRHPRPQAASAQRALTSADLPATCITHSIVRGMRTRRASLRAIGLGIAGTLVASLPFTAVHAASGDVAADLAKRLSNPAIKGDLYVSVRDMTADQTLFQRGAEQSTLPASNQKILTAVAVLDALGPDAPLQTVVRAYRDGVVLVGGGDPLLSTGQVDALAAATAKWAAARGMTRLPVWVDDSLFPRPSAAPGWIDGYQPWVVAPVRSLSFLGDYSWNANTHVMSRFSRALRTHGVPASRRGRAADSMSAGSVVASQGHSVKQAVTVMLRESENNVAEVLFRQVGVADRGIGTWDAARGATAQRLARLDIPLRGMYLADGSGASRADRVPPAALVAALDAAADTAHPRLAPIIYGAALPTAGRTGTLGPRYGRFTSKPSRCAAGKVLAKTGSLRDVISLSGVARRQDGHVLAFSFVVNRVPSSASGYRLRVALDGLAATLVGCW